MHIILWLAQILDYCLDFFYKEDMTWLYITHLLKFLLQPYTRIHPTPKVTSGYIGSRVRKYIMASSDFLMVTILNSF